MFKLVFFHSLGTSLPYCEKVLNGFVYTLRQKHKLLILSRLSDFMTCSEHFHIFSEGSVSQLWIIRHSFTQIANSVILE